VASAVGKEDGLAVLGVFFEQTEADSDNGVLEKILAQLSEVSNMGAETRMNDTLQADELLPENNDIFFRYRGSLTTPTCDEGVLWTVLENTAPISMQQVISIL
jgi:carbonic anhydrase